MTEEVSTTSKLIGANDAAIIAAARRKRRKTLLRSGHQSSHKKCRTRSTGGPSLVVVGSTCFKNASTKLVNNDVHRDVASSCSSSASSSSCSSSDFLMLRSVPQSPTPVLIPPTIAGVHAIAGLLLAGKTVVVPTECTYEVITELKYRWFPSPSAPAYSSPSPIFLDGSNGNSSAPKANKEVLSGKLEMSGWTRAIQRLHRESVHDVDNKRITAPAEQLQQQVVPAPYLYVHPSEIGRCDFLRAILPKKLYAARGRDGQILAVHSFNESLYLLRLLTAKLWPGPVLFRVALDQPIPGLTTPQSRGNGNSQHYLCLRSFCHPLAVKVFKEYQQRCEPVHPCSPHQHKNHHHHHPDDDGKNCLSQSMRDDVQKNEEWPHRHQRILLGLPLLRRQGNVYWNRSDPSNDQSRADYVTAASQAKHGNVLQGEAQLEFLSVPTCEHGGPCPTSIWVNARDRTIRIEERHNDDVYASSSGPMDETQTILSQAQLRQALRFEAKNSRERIIQSVLLKWKLH